MDLELQVRAGGDVRELVPEGDAVRFRIVRVAAVDGAGRPHEVGVLELLKALLKRVLERGTGKEQIT
jgi:hypothetical protein